MAAGAGASVKTSHRELYALLVKTGRGLGLPIGDAQDAARAAAWLSLRGYAGVEAMLATGPASAPARPRIDDSVADVVGPADGRSDPASGSVPIGTAEVVEMVSAGGHGPGLVDLVAAGRGSLVLRLSAVDSPLLLFGLCASAATDHRLRFELTVGSGPAHALDGFDCRPRPPRLLPQSSPLTISCRPVDAEQLEAEPRRWPTEEISVDDDTWSAANELAARTYVPSDERSRMKGAGAGLTDND
ncbi:MAG: DUF3726 domain-containing protein [Acidimicrobiales bacterium]